MITWEYREKVKFISFFNYEFILCVLCGLKKSLNLGDTYPDAVYYAIWNFAER